jgi:Protein of unknown function (DUF2946)
MFARVHLRIGSLIGLLAILMATLAPTISHIVAARRGMDASSAIDSMPTHSMGAMLFMPLHSMGAMHSMHSMHEMHEMHDRRERAGESMPHSSAPNGDDCGYCSFFAHLPAVPAIETPFLAIAWAIEHRKATRFESIRRHEALTSYQSRAPPAFS